MDSREQIQLTLENELTGLIPNQCVLCPFVMVSIQHFRQQFQQTYSEQGIAELFSYSRQAIRVQVKDCDGLIPPPGSHPGEERSLGAICPNEPVRH